VTTSSTSASSGISPTAPYVAACLHALGNDQIAASVNRLHSFRDRADLPARQRATGMHQADQTRVRSVVEELHQPGPSGGQLDVVELAPIQERHQEVDSKRPRMGLFDRGDAGGQGNQTRVLQHAQTTGSTDRDGQLRGARAAHGSLLDWHLAADQLGKGRRQHGRSIAKLRLLA
jgi:hypothetical protein